MASASFQRRCAGAIVALAMAWPVVARAQGGMQHKVYLPRLVRDPTPIPTATSDTSKPHCRDVVSSDFEHGPGGWTFGETGSIDLVKVSDPVVDAGPTVVELRPGTDGTARITSPVFTAPDLPGLEKEIELTYKFRSRAERSDTDDRLTATFFRVPAAAFSGRADGGLSIGSATQFWRSSPLAILFAFSAWTEWPAIQLRMSATGSGLTGMIWQIDLVRVELCYKRPFRPLDIGAHDR